MSTKYVEPAHEALIRAWDRALQWRREEAEWLTLQRSVTEATLAHQRKGGGDWSADPRLDRVVRHLQSDPYWLNKAETNFIHGSKRKRRTVRSVIVGTGGVLSVGLLGVVFIAGQARLLRSRNLFEEAQRLSSQRDFIGAELKAAESLLHEDRQETRQLLLDARLRAFRLTSSATTESVLAVNGRLRAVASLTGQRGLRISYLEGANPSVELHAPSGIECARFSSDGQLLAYGTLQGEIYVFDLKSKSRPRRLNPALSGQAVTAIAFDAPYSRLLYAVQGRRGTGRSPSLPPQVWEGDLKDWTISKVTDLEANVWGFDLGDRGRRLAYGDNNFRINFRVRSGSDTRDQSPGRWPLTRSVVRAEDVIMAVRFSPDERSIATTGADGLIRILDARSGEELRRIRGPGGDILDVAFSKDGSKIASAVSDGSIRLYEARTGQILNTIRVSSSPNRVEFTPEGQVVCGSDDGKAYLFAPGWSNYYSQFGEVGGVASALAFRPESRELIIANQPPSSSGEPSKDSVLSVYDARTNKLKGHCYPHSGQIHSIEYSLSGHIFAAASDDKSITIRKATTTFETVFQKRMKGMQQSVAFSDGYLGFGGWDKEFHLMSLTEFPVVKLSDLRTFAHMPPDLVSRSKVIDQSVIRVAAIPGTNDFLTAGGSACLQRWDGNTGERRWAIQDAILLDRGIWGMAVSPDGRWVAVGGTDRTLRIVGTGGKRIATPWRSGSTVTNIAISPNGHWLAASSGSNVYLWQVKSIDGRPSLGEPWILRVAQRPVWTLAFSGDSSLLAACDLGGLTNVYRTAELDYVARGTEREQWVYTSKRHPLDSLPSNPE